ncbi:MAG: dodecin family protein [Pseudomonadota bacterium]|jgi:flavin-binding protein dodecin
MSNVVKVIEVSSQSSKGFEDAVSTGLKKVAKSVKNIQGAWVNEMKVVTTPEGKVTHWRVNLRISFVVD